MARMLDALRRLERANRLVTPAAPACASRAAPSAPAVLVVDVDEPPYEPTFGPLVTWDRRDAGFAYASHAIDDALDSLNDLANDAAETVAPSRLATDPIVDLSREELPAVATLDEIDPAAAIELHRAENQQNLAEVTIVGLDDASAVAADVLSTIQFAEHWATIALEEFGVAPPAAAPEYPPPEGDFALPSAASSDDAAPSLSAAPVEPAEAPRESSEPQPRAVGSRLGSSERVVESDESARPQASPAELAAMLDLSDAVLATQYTQLGERMLRELTTTTKTCAAIVSIEHQPHVSDVALRAAMTLCRGGKQVLVIDAALSEKHLTNGLAMPVEFGLSEVLKGRVPWQQAVRATATPGLCVMPAGRLTPPRLADDDHRLKDVLKELTSQWDLVLLDGGSLAEASARYVAAAARNVYLVVRLGETDADATAQAIESLAARDVVLRGCIVTNAAID